MVTEAANNGGAELELQTEVIVPIVTATDVAADPGSFMHWEYLDPNTVRTFEIPVQIGSTVAPSILAESYISSAIHDNYGLPPGFHAHQQFPYGPPPGGAVSVGGTGSNGHAPPPPPPPTSTSETNNHSILIQRVPHRQRKGRGNVMFGVKTIQINNFAKPNNFGGFFWGMKSSQKPRKVAK